MAGEDGKFGQVDEYHPPSSQV